MSAVAQTNIQLYNQLRARDWPLDDLLVVHRAYELLSTLYCGFVQVDGKPFLAHGVGVASILAELDQPADMIAVGLLHNIYGNADFGDGRRSGVTAARRRLVRDAVGDEVESLLAHFQEVREELLRDLDRTLQTLPQRSESDRRLMLLEVVDFIEKFIDLGVLYYGPRGQALTSQSAERKVREIARALGDARLMEMLESALAAASAEASEVPAELHPSDGHVRSLQLLPRSCRRRPAAWARLELASLRDRVQLRTRLRRVLKVSARRRRSVAS